MRPIEDLINSGKTLTKKETLAVERYIQANSEQISLRELNDLKCISAIRKRWNNRIMNKGFSRMNYIKLTL